MSITNWLIENSIPHNIINDNLFSIKSIGNFLLVRDKDEIFNSDMCIILDDDEEDVECDFYCFLFGDSYYYSKDRKLSSLSLLKYIGDRGDERSPFLGLHGSFDLLNGSRNYKDWCTKANFLNISSLAICENNTLAGVLRFQLNCKSNNIKPIIGAQYLVLDDNSRAYRFKCYVINEIGWSNILLMNIEVNVINNGFIDKKRFCEITEGLFVVIDTKYTPFEYSNYFVKRIQNLYYQLEDVIFDNEDNDKEYLINLKKYIQSDIKPVLISDAFYLDENDFYIKPVLNLIGSKSDFRCKGQHLKTYMDVVNNLYAMFNEEDFFWVIMDKAITNLFKIEEDCTWNIPVEQRLLPEYLFKDNEKILYGDKEGMFFSLIEEGINKKLGDKTDIEKYLDRINIEWDVIVNNGYTDYFLILWDIIKWARSNNILVGLGRGSAGGSLIAYLLDIIAIDPLEFDLLFERFLNNGRAQKSYPDIDTDFEASKRDEVKRYMEERYGWENVCSVGTYTNLKIKQSLKDLSKLKGLSFEEVNHISGYFELDDINYIDIFRVAQEKPVLKTFINNHPDIIEDMKLILNQPKSKSIHACATIITPKGKSVFESFPVRIDRKGEEDVIVSEWEGGELETAGYLKEDILGIKQLDKYRFIIDLIKETTGEVIDIYSIPYGDRRVIKRFQEGLNGDIFHLGSPGLTSYCKQLQPDNINDLIAAIALYRPGSMDINSHNEYVLRKNGERDFTHHFMMEPITRETYGLIIYQEQVMRVFTDLADFTLAEADDIRRAIGKKKRDLILKQKEFFINKCIDKGCKEDEANEIWNEVEVHAGYSFNKSHAACYAITGYIGQWLKIHFPIQFWTSAFEFDDTDPKKSKIDKYISEINRSRNSVKLRPPNINESSTTFTFNFEKNEIYWSLSRVSQVGEKSINEIIEERNKNGLFYSLAEFLERVNKRVINKAVLMNLIYSGAFDDIYGIINIEDRRKIIEDFYKLRAVSKKDRAEPPIHKFNWELKQKNLCGYGELDYKYVIRNFTDFDLSDFIDGFNLQDGDVEGSRVVVAGVISFIKERSSKKTGDYCSIELESNHEKIFITIWNESYEDIKNSLEIGKIFLIKGKVVSDSYRGVYAIQSVDDSKIFII